MKTIFYTAILSLALFSCAKKPMPEEVDGTPVFSLHTQLDGQEDLTLEAGNNDYFMHSSYSQDQNNIYIFRGDLIPGCKTGCGYGLSVLINDHKISEINSKTNIDSALFVGKYALSDRTLYPYTQNVLLVPSVPKADPGTYKWTFTDDKQNTETITTYSLVKTFTLGKTYTVALTFDDEMGGCIITHKNVFKVGNPYHVNVSSLMGSTPFVFKFSASTTKLSSFRYRWEFGDGFTSTEAAPQHTYSTQENFQVKLLMIDNNSNDSCITYHQVSTTNSQCQANFNAIFYPIDYSKVLRSITILLTDLDGNVYSSADATQPASSFVQIDKVEEYKANKDGNPTKRLTLKFDCAVKNGGKVKFLNKSTAFIAVAYQK